MIGFVTVFIVLLLLIIIFIILIVRAETKNSIEREIEETKQKIKLGRLQ